MLERMDEKFKPLNICKSRKASPTYREIVFFNKDMKKWDRVLTGSLGEPVNSKWKNPEKNMEKMTRKYGGIRKGQTLYIKEFENFSIMAMIWPWKDKCHSTLKLSVVH